MTAAEQAHEIVMWGETRVGKTTALATALCRAPQWLDTTAPESVASISTLTPIWNALNTNRVPRGTPSAIPYPVRRRDGRLLRFRDMRGTDALTLAGDDLKAVHAAAALMIFVTWPGAGFANELVAAMNPLRIHRDRDRPMALVITKIDRFLTIEEAGVVTLSPDPDRLANLRLSRAGRAGATVPREFIDCVKLFEPRATFPVSVYGYREGSYPAHYPDEFGRLVPWDISPLNVERPFDYIVSELP